MLKNFKCPRFSHLLVCPVEIANEGGNEEAKEWVGRNERKIDYFFKKLAYCIMESSYLLLELGPVHLKLQCSLNLG